MSRPPVVGDTIGYETRLDDKGKLRAINAKIEGVSQVLTVAPIDRKRQSEKTSHTQQRPLRNHNTHKPPYKKSGFRIMPVLLIFSAISAYIKFADYKASDSQPGMTIANSAKSIQQFQCQGKVHCTEMSSYEEAVFYLQNCPGTKMDGDKDGIPCERQF
jgi:hypothetical protein